MKKQPALVNPRKRPTQKRSRQTVEHILQVTAQLLSENKPDLINTNLIARTANVNIATLYQYFPNKHAIIYSLYQSWLEEITGGYDQIEDQYFQQADWQDFFTRLYQRRLKVSFSPQTEANLDRMMESSEELSALERQHAEKIARRMAKYLVFYGSNWSEKQLINLSRLIYETNWATIYLLSQQPAKQARQTEQWSLVAYLALIEQCLVR